VPDVQRALATLAAGWRCRFRGPLVAVTGSNGKTTVTQMIAAVLRAWLGPAALATQGNYNNHVGLPLTVLRLRPQRPPWHRAAVVELGMNHPGEIAQLAAIAQPTVALVNNAQREHQEFMASVEAVARENGSAIEALPPRGTAVFPAGDPHAGLWHALAAGRPTLTFADADLDAATAARAAIVGRARWPALGARPGDARPDGWQLAIDTPVGPLATTLRLAGRHNVHNALAATACAVAAGVPAEAIARGLAAFQPVVGRSRLLAATLRGHPLALVDDSYNANPDSVRAAIELLAGLPAPRWLLLGDMGEVGERGPEFHREVGMHAARCGIETLWGVGLAARDAVDAYRAAAGAPDGAATRHFADVDALLAATGDAPDAASALVKGSRFMRLERVVAALAGTGPAGGH
jgi:UDP-N-acetylmuramoyl-tripeptide--D-alanyl-D-alanine ligase